MPQSTINNALSLQAHANGKIITDSRAHLVAALGSAVRGRKRYAILNFPNHANIGDSAIFMGELSICREVFGTDPELVTEEHAADVERVGQLDSDVVLLLHGGGNFGDLYPHHHTFRNTIISLYKDRKIILMPQSIHLEDPENLRITREAINSHPDITFFVRDLESEIFAGKHFQCPIQLTPDMAFGLGPIAKVSVPDLDVLGILRNDKERIFDSNTIGSKLYGRVEITDWPREHRHFPLILKYLPRSVRHRVWPLPHTFQKWLSPKCQGLHPATCKAFEHLAQQRLELGIAILSRGKAVVTDRLHGHILCLLMGIPHVALDNNYGKIERYSRVWTSGGNFIRVDNEESVPAAMKSSIRMSESLRR